MAFEKIAQYVGLGAPFVAAALMYTLFKFLDKKASGPANRAITAWIKGDRYKQLELKAAVVEGFDHLYGTPLLTIRSFYRSVGLSTLAFGMYQISFVGPFRLDSSFILIILFIPTFLSDYVSLFAVRRLLATKRTTLVSSIVAALLAAAMAFFVVTVLMDVLMTVRLTFKVWMSIDYTPAPNYKDILRRSMILYLDVFFLWIRMAVPVLLVYLWLPLLVLAGTVTVAMNAFFRAVGWAQWFIRRGNSHPLDAIGMVAAGVVFVGASVWQGVSYFALR